MSIDLPNSVTVAQIDAAAALLDAGQLVAFPTETVYGLGGDAANPEAVARIYAAKGRPANHPVIVHLPPGGDPGYWVDDLPADDPFRQARDEFVSSYEKANGQKPNIFGAHLWDAVTLFKRAAAIALKTAKPGTPEFRAALRDELRAVLLAYLAAAGR